MTTSFRARQTCIAVVLGLLCLPFAGPAARADPAAPAASSTGPDEAAWQRLDKALTAFQNLRPDTVVGGGRESFEKDYFPKAGTLADEFEAFLKAYPASPHAADAWGTWMDLLNAAAYRLPERKAQLEQVEGELLADPKLPRDRRDAIRGNQLDRAASVAERERMLRSLEGEYKKTGDFYLMRLLDVARMSEPPHAFELADELLKLTEGRTGGIREDAVRLKATLARVGKPFELKFTALDGRAVDLKDYRGKVVLVDFWATWCPPCVYGMADVARTWAALHDQGFEVIGVSYDTDRETLKRFLKRNEITWPQFFDERGWDAPLVQSLGRPGPPEYWLIARDGLLVTVNAREDLDSKVRKSLAAPPGATQRAGKGE